MKIELTQEEAELCYMILRGAYVDMEVWSFDDDDDDDDDDQKQKLEALNSVLDRLAEIANIAR